MSGTNKYTSSSIYFWTGTMFLFSVNEKENYMVPDFLNSRKDFCTRMETVLDISSGLVSFLSL